MPDEPAHPGRPEPELAVDDPDAGRGAADDPAADADGDAATAPRPGAHAPERDAHAPDSRESRAGRDDPFEHAGHDEQTAGADPDYYAVLGVPAHASAAEIRHAYHRLAKLWHPDRYMDAPPQLRARAERRMRALVAAYGVLGDNERRQAYDGRFAPGGHGAWIDLDYTPPIWMGGAARPPYAPSRDYSSDPGPRPGSPNGAGIFLGALATVLALSVAIRSLGGGGADAGSYIGFGLAALLGALAIWCLVAAEAVPVRLARRWMESTPPLDATEGAHAAAGWQGATADAATPGGAGTEADEGDEAAAAFERLVDEALASIPAEFQREMPNVVVRVKANPTDEELARLEVGKHGLLLGLYQGVELTDQGAAGAGPEVITIFREPIVRYCHGDPIRVRKQVRRTVLHEVAHHFGIDHEQMPDWIR